MVSAHTQEIFFRRIGRTNAERRGRTRVDESIPYFRIVHLELLGVIDEHGIGGYRINYVLTSSVVAPYIPDGFCKRRQLSVIFFA